MICKWCGAVVDEKSERCASCGRTIPPLSDCGGFHGLYKANGSAPQSAAAARDPLPQTPVQPGDSPVSAPNSAPSAAAPRNKRTAIVLGILCAVLLVGCFVLMILLLSQKKAPAQNGSAATETSGISDVLPAMPTASETQGSFKPKPEVTTEAAEPTENTEPDGSVGDAISKLP